MEGSEQLRLQLSVDLIPAVFLFHVAADIGIKQNRVGEPVAVFTETADRDVNIDASPLIHHPEGNGTGSTIFVANDLFGVEIIDPLILSCFAAKSKPLSDLGKGIFNAFTQVACEKGGSDRGVIDKFARNGADIHHLAVLHNTHALAVGHRHHRAVGDDVGAALGVGATAGRPFLSLAHQYIHRNRFAIKIFLPLVGHYAARGAQCRFNKSHVQHSFFINLSPA